LRTSPLGVRAAGGLLEYLEDTQKENYVALQPLRTYTIADYLILDHQSRRNLEITATVRDNTFHGSLLWALDRTSTAMGGRALRRWLLQPLLDIKGIRARHETIQELVENTGLRQDLRQLLRGIYDLERLTGTCGFGDCQCTRLSCTQQFSLKITGTCRTSRLWFLSLPESFAESIHQNSNSWGNNSAPI
jgi:DNA mismatch repair protein MutS